MNTRSEGRSLAGSLFLCPARVHRKELNDAEAPVIRHRGFDIALPPAGQPFGEGGEKRLEETP